MLFYHFNYFFIKINYEIYKNLNKNIIEYKKKKKFIPNFWKILTTLNNRNFSNKSLFENNSNLNISLI